MRKRMCVVGIVSAATGLFATTGPAIADSVDNDGVNAGNDNNVSVLPVQLCGNNVAVLGAVAPLLSPQNVNCTNAPIVDHPSSGQHSTPSVPGHDKHPGCRGASCTSTKPIGHTPATGSTLPSAPQPSPVSVHHAVAG